MEKYLEVLKQIGLQASEDLVIKALIPFLEEKVKDSASPIDDIVMAAVKPVLVEFAEKIKK